VDEVRSATYFGRTLRRVDNKRDEDFTVNVFKNVVAEIQANELAAKEAAEAALIRAKEEEAERVERIRQRFTEVGVYSFMSNQADQMKQLGFWNDYHADTVEDRALVSIRFVPKAGEEPSNQHPVREANVVGMVIACSRDTVRCDAGGVTGTSRFTEQIPLPDLNLEVVTRWFETFARTALEERSAKDTENDAPRTAQVQRSRL